jgi:hypothetical protein
MSASRLDPLPQNATPWRELPSSKEHLVAQMHDMYWDGVKHELSLILLTLKEWQRPKYASVMLNDETDLSIHGYDTFIDQINESSRDFAKRYGEWA